MVSRSDRESTRTGMFLTAGVVVAATALLAWIVLPDTGAQAQAPLTDLGVVGVESPGFIDDGDVRPRLLVAADVLTTSAAAAASSSDAGPAADTGLSANDQLLVDEWYGLGDGTTPQPAGDPLELTSRALQQIDGVDAAQHVTADLFEVVVADGGGPAVEAAIAAVPGVRSVDEVGLSWSTATSDQYYYLQWGLTNTGRTITGLPGTPGIDIGYEQARRSGDGDGVVVAVVDSGIDVDHPDLRHAIWTNPGEICDNGIDDDGNGYVDDCKGWDFVRNDHTVDDAGSDNDHGTHVAGTIAAASDNRLGVASLAPGASIMPVKVFDGGGAPMTRISRAIGYAIDNGADIINLSLGGDSPDASLQREIQRAQAADILVIAAAGNAQRDIDARPFYPASYGMANILSVGSHAPDGSLSSFSNYGSRAVDVFAPGSSIVSTMPGGEYAYMSGTSMATPMVASVAAVAAQVRGTTSAAELKAYVMESVVAEPALTDSLTGGRVWAPAAITDAPVPSLLNMTIRGLDNPETGEVSARATLSMPVPDDVPVEMTTTLARVWDGRLAAVVDHEVSWETPAGTAQVTTGQDGSLPVLTLDATEVEALRDGTLSWGLTSDLPPGEFVWVVQPAVDGQPMDAAMTGFRVTYPGGAGRDGTPTPTPAPDDGGGAPAPAPAPTPAPTPAPGTGGDGPAPDTGDDAPTPGDGNDAPTPTPDSGDGTPTPDSDGGGDGPAPDNGGDGGTPAPSPAPDAGTPLTPAPDSDDDQPGPDSDAPAPDADTPAPTPGTGGEAPAPDADGNEPAPRPDDDRATGPVRPNSGPVEGGTYVAVSGAFEAGTNYYVHVGEQVLAPVAVMPSELIVITTNFSAGTYDVRVYDSTGRLVVAHVDAFTFTDGATPVPGPAPDSGGDAPGPDDGDGDDRSPTPDDGGGSPPTPVPPSTRITAPDGMRLETATTGVLAGRDRSHWMASYCGNDPCASVRFES